MMSQIIARESLDVSDSYTWITWWVRLLHLNHRICEIITHESLDESDNYTLITGSVQELHEKSQDEPSH